MEELEGQSEQLISFDVVVDGEHHATVSIDGELDMSGIDPLAARVAGRTGPGAARGGPGDGRRRDHRGRGPGRPDAGR